MSQPAALTKAMSDVFSASNMSLAHASLATSARSMTCRPCRARAISSTAPTIRLRATDGAFSKAIRFRSATSASMPRSSPVLAAHPPSSRAPRMPSSIDRTALSSPSNRFRRHLPVTRPAISNFLASSTFGITDRMTRICAFMGRPSCIAALTSRSTASSGMRETMRSPISQSESSAANCLSSARRSTRTSSAADVASERRFSSRSQSTSEQMGSTARASSSSLRAEASDKIKTSRTAGRPPTSRARSMSTAVSRLAWKSLASPSQRSSAAIPCRSSLPKMGIAAGSCRSSTRRGSNIMPALSPSARSTSARTTPILSMSSLSAAIRLVSAPPCETRRAMMSDGASRSTCSTRGPAPLPRPIAMLGMSSSIAPLRSGCRNKLTAPPGAHSARCVASCSTAVLAAGMSCPCIFRAIAPTKSQASLGGRLPAALLVASANRNSSVSTDDVSLSIPELTMSNSPKAAVGARSSLSSSSSHNNAIRRAATLSAARSPRRSISLSDSSLGTGSSKTRRTIVPVHLCRSICDERPSTRRPGQSENLALAFDGEKTRSRSRPPIFRGARANVESANRRRISGHSAVSRRKAISSGSGASNTTTGFTSSRKSASSSSLARKLGTGGSRSSSCSSSSMRTASVSVGN
ncbi:hypothetical protein E4O92_12515 [Massilia horti]|uniref:Uncharacterized protein n=1 Tax=Massilia horti TaxID=2562153 RepID=A0A4Y9SZA4_9BURK|nr:hypothetical protein E4O92_12515 [Massilia horti]